MEQVTLKTPLGFVALEHSGTKASAKGDELALSWWERRMAEGLFGVHGHIFNVDDCDICDVIAAAQSAVGAENVHASEAALRLAIHQTRATPQGAIP
jgi:hypothetical protein